MIKPMADRILVKPYQNSETSVGGIYTGQATTTFVSGMDKTVQVTVGKVIAIGEGKYDKRGKRRPPDVPIGSYVTFSDTCGLKAEVDGDEYLFIREQDVVGFMDKPETVELVYDN